MVSYRHGIMDNKAWMLSCFLLHLTYCHLSVTHITGTVFLFSLVFYVYKCLHYLISCVENMYLTHRYVFMQAHWLGKYQYNGIQGGLRFLTLCVPCFIWYAWRGDHHFALFLRSNLETITRNLLFWNIDWNIPHQVMRGLCFSRCSTKYKTPDIELNVPVFFEILGIRELFPCK
jgi:hypothetical protein